MTKTVYFLIVFFFLFFSWAGASNSLKGSSDSNNRELAIAAKLEALKVQDTDVSEDADDSDDEDWLDPILSPWTQDICYAYILLKDCIYPLFSNFIYSSMVADDILAIPACHPELNEVDPEKIKEIIIINKQWIEYEEDVSEYMVVRERYKPFSGSIKDLQLMMGRIEDADACIESVESILFKKIDIKDESHKDNPYTSVWIKHKDKGAGAVKIYRKGLRFPVIINWVYVSLINNSLMAIDVSLPKQKIVDPTSITKIEIVENGENKIYMPIYDSVITLLLSDEEALGQLIPVSTVLISGNYSAPSKECLS